MDIEKDSNREAFECWFRTTATYKTLWDFISTHQINIKSVFVKRNGKTYQNDCVQIAWEAWQAAKAQAIPEGFVLVPRRSIEHWYLDEGEYLWMDEPDNWLCDMDVGDVQEVEHKEYIVTESNTLYATKVWDGENQDVSSWEFFNSKDDAEKAAEYCKAMIEAR